MKFINSLKDNSYAFKLILFQPAKVTAHWHKGTTYMVKFEESVISRDKQLEER